MVEGGDGVIEGVNERPWTWEPPEIKKPRYRMVDDGQGRWILEPKNRDSVPAAWLCLAAVHDDDLPHDSTNKTHQCSRLRAHPNNHHRCDCGYTWAPFRVTVEDAKDQCPGYIRVGTEKHSDKNWSHLCDEPRGHRGPHTCSCKYTWNEPKQRLGMGGFQEACPVFIENTTTACRDGGFDHMCDEEPRHVGYHECRCEFSWKSLDPGVVIPGLRGGNHVGFEPGRLYGGVGSTGDVWVDSPLPPEI